MSKRIIRVGLGGTFDHFHQGHKQFIKFAANLGNELLIGVTNQSLTKHKAFSSTIQPLYVRKNSVNKFCTEEKIKAKIIEIADIYGPTINKESKIDKLCVTEDTISGAQEINKLRQTMNMRPLPTFICPLTKAQDQKPINSTRIRAGEIDRDGLVYKEILNSTLKLTANQKEFFKLKHGELIDHIESGPNKICVVGDTSIQKFIDQDWHFDLGIYDKIEQRKPSNRSFYKTVRPNITVNNIAGTISHQLSEAVHTALKNSWQFIEVVGEEDLAVIPVVLSLPLKSLVYYGLPSKGLVELEVTEQIKNKFSQNITSQ